MILSLTTSRKDESSHNDIRRIFILHTNVGGREITSSNRIELTSSRLRIKIQRKKRDNELAKTRGWQTSVQMNTIRLDIVTGVLSDTIIS